MTKKLDRFHWHEALDRTSLVANMFDDHVFEHPAITSNKKLKAMAEKVSEKIWTLYEKIGDATPI